MIEWKSIVKYGNPKEDGEYLVTYIDRAGNYKVCIRRFQSGNWWFDNAVAIAYMDKPEPYDFFDFRKDMESLKNKTDV